MVRREPGLAIDGFTFVGDLVDAFGQVHRLEGQLDRGGPLAVGLRLEPLLDLGDRGHLGESGQDFARRYPRTGRDGRAVLDRGDDRPHVDASEQALLESGESYYGARDVYWLSHIINAEAGNQPMDGQIAVGNVVLNRVADERFPNSVKEVVFDRRGGVAQFSPTADGRISLTPDEDAELAAKLAFEGYDPVGESLYFINPSACNASWFNSRLTYTATIGDHVFYA